MPTDRIRIRKESAVYAQVLLEATQHAGTTVEVLKQLKKVKAVIRDNLGLRTTLFDRSIPQDARIQIVNEIFEDFDASMLAMLGVMIKRESLRLLDRVIDGYNDRAEEALDAVFIEVTTSISLDDALRDAIKAKYSAQFGHDVILHEYVDESIMGGIILSARGFSIDASLASQLENARRVLSGQR